MKKTTVLLAFRMEKMVKIFNTKPQPRSQRYLNLDPSATFAFCFSASNICGVRRNDEMAKKYIQSSEWCSGEKFVEETTRLITEWNNQTPLGNAALKCLLIMPLLLLQKPSKKSKAKDHTKCLERRLEFWSKGDFNALGRRMSDHTKETIVLSKIFNIYFLAKKFSNLMFVGKVNATLNLLSKGSSAGIIAIDDATMRTLKQKHPHRPHQNITISFFKAHSSK